jgi:peroxiredoxin
MDTLSLVNQLAPDFSLDDLDGASRHLLDCRGRIVLLVFWSAECPWSEEADLEIMAELPRWGERVVWWSIASNANEPIGLLRQVAYERKLPVVLPDPAQQVADRYAALTTPHAFLIDDAGIIRYQGAVNNRTFRQRVPTVFYLRRAVDSLLAGKMPQPAETAPYGCTLVRLF